MTDLETADTAIFDRIPAPDPCLAQVVAMINGSQKGEIGVTLNVQGSVVSGLLISGERFFLGLQEAIRSSSGADARFAEIWQPAVDAYRADREADEGLDEAMNKTVFIHLRDTKVINGSTANVGFWRGRLESVDGWSLARLDV